MGTCETISKRRLSVLGSSGFVEGHPGGRRLLGGPGDRLRS